MKYSEIKGEAALDAFVEILEPAAEIMQDKEVEAAFRTGKRIKAVKLAIQNHKQAVMQVLAVLDGQDVATYQPGLMSIPLKLIEVFNDPEVVSLFMSQSQETQDKSSGSATENTEEKEL